MEIIFKLGVYTPMRYYDFREEGRIVYTCKTNKKIMFQVLNVHKCSLSQHLQSATSAFTFPFIGTVFLLDKTVHFLPIQIFLWGMTWRAKSFGTPDKRQFDNALFQKELLDSKALRAWLRIIKRAGPFFFPETNKWHDSVTSTVEISTHLQIRNQ